MFARYWIILAAVVFSCSAARPLWAQRYLSEFVGTSTLKSSTSVLNLSARLEFDVQLNRSVDGGFTLGDPFNIVNDDFAAQGFLLPKDKCNVVLQKTNTTGGLRFIEIPFDANSFALIGRVNVSYLRSTILMRAGKYAGTAAVVRPVIDGVPILPDNLGSVAVVSSLSRVRSVHGVAITRQYASRAVDGQLNGSGLLSGFQVTITASPRWTYIVGHNEDRFLAMRVASSLNADGELDMFSGDFAIYDELGQLVDTGTIVGD